MDLTASDATEILRQIEQNRWGWLKIKRFKPESYATVEERYSALETHHAEETGRMIEVISELCRLAASLNRKDAERFYEQLQDQRDIADAERILADPAEKPVPFVPKHHEC